MSSLALLPDRLARLRHPLAVFDALSAQHFCISLGKLGMLRLHLVRCVNPYAADRRLCGPTPYRFSGSTTIANAFSGASQRLAVACNSAGVMRA